MARPTSEPAGGTGGGAEPFGNAARVIAGLARIVELALDDAELTLGQYRIMSYLAGRPSIPTHLASWLGVKKQSMTRQLDGLVQRGLLERRTSDTDRRQVIHTVTTEGRRALRRTEERLEGYVAALLDLHLDPAEEAEVRKGFSVAGEALTRAWARTIRGDFDRPA